VAGFQSSFLFDLIGDALDGMPLEDRDVLTGIWDVWLKSLADQLLVMTQTDEAKALFRVPVEFNRESIAFLLNDDTRIEDVKKVESGGGVTISAFRTLDLALATQAYWIEILTDPADSAQTRVRIYDNIQDALAGAGFLGESFSPGFGSKTLEPIGGFGGAPDPSTLKASVRAATTAIVTGTPVYNNIGGVSLRGQITFAIGPTVIDGVAIVNGNRILVKNEGDLGGLGGDANGLWERTSATVWDRATDFDTDPEVVSDTFVGVQEGTVNGDKSFRLTTADPITIGGAAGTALTFVEFTGARLSYTYFGAPAAGQLTRLFVDRFAYSVNVEIESIPELFLRTDIGAHSPLGIPLTENIDYVVSSGSIVFLTEPSEFQFAPALVQNRQLVFNNFGFLIDYFKENSRDYRRDVQGLWFAFWNGPTVANIELGAVILFGFPIIDGGEILSITTEVGGAKTIRARTRSGLIESFLVPAPFTQFIVVEVGDTFDTFAPLVVPFEVADYITDRNIHDRLAFPEVQKFFQWFVIFEAQTWFDFIEEFGLEILDLDAVRNFVDRIKPKYTRGLIVTRKDFLDQLSMASSLDAEEQIVNGEERINQNWVNYLFLVAFQVVNGETEAAYIGGSQPDWDLDTGVVGVVEHITINDLPIDGGALLYEEPPP
jgi:hypothetical protein